MDRKEVFVWVAAGLVLLVVGVAGAGKFLDTDRWEADFEGWGLPTALVVPIGIIELGGALLLFWPRGAFVGGALVAVTMAGAVITHIVHAEWAAIPMPTAMAGLSVFVAWRRAPPAIAERLTAPPAQ